MRYSCLFGECKQQGPQNHQNMSFCCIVLTFECYIQHPNVATFEGSFECRTFVYALVVGFEYYTVKTDMPPEHACATIAQIICANPIHCTYCC